jgi:hypothetical protein
MNNIDLIELYFSPIDDRRFKAIVTQATGTGEGETELSLPFIDSVNEDRRLTILKTLEASQFNQKYFSQPEELNWMQENGIVTSNRDNFEPDYLQNIGQILYNALCPPNSGVKSLLEKAINTAEANGNLLQIRLKFAADGERFADYPWELLHNGTRFLGHHQMEISRYIAYEAVVPKLPPVKKLRVLLISSEADDSALGLQPLSKKERQAIRQGLKTAQEKQQIDLIPLEAATLNTLRAYLTENTGDKSPHVIHFDGHGLFGQKCQSCGTMHKTTRKENCKNCDAPLPEPQGYLLFEDEDGEPNYVSAADLGTLIQTSALYSPNQANSPTNSQANSPTNSQTGGVVLVVLSACQSGMAVAGESLFNGAAQKLIEHRVPAVVAMQYSVGVESATKFAEQFYRSLGQQNSLAVAMTQARAAMGVDGNQWYRPVLYLRWQDTACSVDFCNTCVIY